MLLLACVCVRDENRDYDMMNHVCWRYSSDRDIECMYNPRVGGKMISAGAAWEFGGFSVIDVSLSVLGGEWGR